MAFKTPKTIIDVSSLTLIKILFIIVAVAFLFYVRDIILVVFVSLVLASAFDPWVDWFQKHKIPRAVGLLFIYLVLVFVLGGVVYLIIPPIVIEVNELSSDFPIYWEKISGNISEFRNYSESQGWNQNIQESLETLQSNISGVAGGVFSTVFSFFGGIISFFLILVITFYMTVEEQAMKRLTRAVMPVKYQPYFTHLVNRMQEKIGRWLRGQLILSVLIFGISWIALLLLGVKYALVLALFAGITELIPYLGPFIGAVPAVFIAFTQSPTLAVMVLVVYLIIQFLENHVLVPKVMQKAVGLNPVIIIIAMLIGAKVAGILGIMLAVPVATALSVLASDITGSRNN